MSTRPADVRVTAAGARTLWFGSLLAGAILGGLAGLVTFLTVEARHSYTRTTAPKGTPA